MADELSPTDGRNDGESSFIILQSDYGGLFQGEKQQRFWLIIFFCHSFYLGVQMNIICPLKQRLNL